MVPVVEVAIRTIIAMIILFILSKLFIRKPIGEMSFFEFSIMVVPTFILAIGSIIPFILSEYIIVALFIWGGIGALSFYLRLKSETFRAYVFGKETAIIKDGKVLEDQLKKEKLTADELLQKLRANDIFELNQVEFAMIETNGQVTALLKKENAPLTSKLMQIDVGTNKQPEMVIRDGKYLDEGLTNRGLNRSWLETELEKINVLVENVFIGQVDEYGQLTVDLYDDQIKLKEPTEIPLLQSSLLKVYADLEQYALDTEDQQVREMYKRNAEKINEWNEKLSVYFK